MNKQIVALILFSTMAFAVLAGCEKDKPANTTTVSTSTSQPSSDSDNLNETAQQAYMDFISGKRSLVTAEKFRDDDADGNSSVLTFGEYTIDEIKTR